MDRNSSSLERGGDGEENTMLPIEVSKTLDCYSCVDNSPLHYSVFCVRTAAATCCRLQVRGQTVMFLNPDTSYEDGVTSVPGADQG